MKLGPKATVTGVNTAPSSGIVVEKPSWTPTGAAIAWVDHGLARCVIWWATHHRSHTKAATSLVSGSRPVI